MGNRLTDAPIRHVLRELARNVRAGRLIFVLNNGRRCSTLSTTGFNAVFERVTGSGGFASAALTRSLRLFREPPGAVPPAGWFGGGGQPWPRLPNLAIHNSYSWTMKADDFE